MKKIRHKFISFVFYLRYIAEQYQFLRLGKILTIMLLVWVLGSNLIYTSEHLYHRKGIEWHNTNFKDYFDTYWNVIVYLTSGVEDYVPDSPYSKFITFLLLITGIVIIGIFTANLVPIIIKSIHDRSFIKQKPPHLLFNNHFIICGQSKKIAGIINQLSYDSIKHNKPILIISKNASKIPIICKNKYKNVWGLEGEAADEEIIKKANIDKANSIIILAKDTTGNSSQIIHSKLINRTLNFYRQHTIIELKETYLLEHLERAHANEIIDINEYSIRLLSQSILTPGVSKFFYEILTVNEHSNGIFLLPIENLIDIYGNNIVGSSYRDIVDLHLNLQYRDFIIIGYKTTNSSLNNYVNCMKSSYENISYVLNPSVDNNKRNINYKLKRTDELIIIAYEKPNTNNKHNNFRKKKLMKKEMAMQGNLERSIKENQDSNNNAQPNHNYQGLYNHIVICNWRKNSEQIIKELHSTNVKDPVPIIIITDQPQEVTQSTEDWMKDVFIIPGSPLNSKVLSKASLETASTAIILSDPRDKEYADSKAIVIALAIEAINRSVHTIVEIIESENRKHFINTHVDEIICVDELTEKLLSQAALTHNISKLYLHLLTESEDTNEVYTIPVPSNFIGKSWEYLQKVFFEYDQEDIIPIGFITEEEKKINERTIHNHFGNIIKVNKMYINPKKKPDSGEKGSDYIFQNGDKLVTIAYCKPDLEGFRHSKES